MYWAVVIAAAAIWYFLDWLLRLQKVGNLGNRHVFITGCDTGFGRELAIQLDRLGFPVFAGCLTQGGCKSLEGITSDRLIALLVDVSREQSIKAAYETIKQSLPNEDSLWAVVNNAGITGQGAVSEMCVKADFQQVCDVNLFGPIEVCRTFMPLLRKSRGRIINMTSMAGRVACPFVPYSVSKYGMEAFSDCLRREVAKFGVKVSIVEPGFFRTSLLNVETFTSTASVGFHRAGSEVQEAYGWDYLTRFRSLMKSTIRNAASRDTLKVVDAYVHAVASRYPRARYVIGYDAWFVVLPMSLAPEWFSDWALGAMETHAVKNNKLASVKSQS